jgi:hypothetical protein
MQDGYTELLDAREALVRWLQRDDPAMEQVLVVREKLRRLAALVGANLALDSHLRGKTTAAVPGASGGGGGMTLLLRAWWLQKAATRVLKKVARLEHRVLP